MKRALLVLAMMLMAVTSYNQTSRRTTNANGSATRSNETKTESQNRGSSTRSNADNNQQQRRDNNSATQTRTENNSGNERTNTRTSNDNGNKDNRYTGNNNNERGQREEYNSRDNEHHGNNENHDNYVNRDRNGSDHNTGYHDRDNNRYTGNTVSVNSNSSRVYQHSHKPNHYYKHEPYNRDYRAVHYVYREPVHVDIYWTRDMYRHYVEMYPEVRYWNYTIGYRINTTSAYFADYYIGEVMNVYGQVNDIFYAAETDEYFLYFGAYYPYHDFTVVMPGYIARQYSNRPMQYFLNQYINVTGLITMYDGKPEIVVKRNFQFNVY
jgi:hypothetical protein